jgi:hypothetical protein
LDELTVFVFEGQELSVRCRRTELKENIAPGVYCDGYDFVGDPSRDLGMIHFAPGCRTPLQLVLEGTLTVEKHVSGKGWLFIERASGDAESHPVGFNGESGLQVGVNIGDIMQWVAANDSELVVAEVCYPPYPETPNRYKNLS